MELPRSLPEGVEVLGPADVLTVFNVERETDEAMGPAVMVEVDPTLLGVAGARLVSTRVSDARSSLLPTSMMLKFGDARARASLRNGCSARNEACEVMS